MFSVFRLFVGIPMVLSSCREGTCGFGLAVSLSLVTLLPEGETSSYFHGPTMSIGQGGSSGRHSCVSWEAPQRACGQHT
jgi:hypothetical protein